MGISTNAYRALCEAADAAQGTIKLGHGSEGWTVQVILGPTTADPVCRAAGAIFPDIAELDSQSRHLLEWLTACRRDAATEEAR